MKKKDIVKDNRYFNKIIKEGIKINSKNFIIYSLSSTFEKPKFGVAVGKKVGNAVIRNKVKRKIRNIIDYNMKSFPTYNDYIIVAKRFCKDEKYDKLLNEMKNVLKKR